MIDILNDNFRRPFSSHRPQKMITVFNFLRVNFSSLMTFLAFHTENLIDSPKIKNLDMMIRCIGGADYFYRYRLQPIVLIIGPITRIRPMYRYSSTTQSSYSFT